MVFEPVAVRHINLLHEDCHEVNADSTGHEQDEVLECIYQRVIQREDVNRGNQIQPPFPFCSSLRLVLTSIV